MKDKCLEDVLKELKSAIPTMKAHKEYIYMIESHLECPNGECPSSACSNLSSSKEICIDVIKQFKKEGCSNEFMLKPWGCKHPKIGRKNFVKISRVNLIDKRVQLSPVNASLAPIEDQLIHGSINKNENNYHRDLGSQLKELKAISGTNKAVKLEPLPFKPGSKLPPIVFAKGSSQLVVTTTPPVDNTSRDLTL